MSNSKGNHLLKKENQQARRRLLQHSKKELVAASLDRFAEQPGPKKCPGPRKQAQRNGEKECCRIDEAQ